MEAVAELEPGDRPADSPSEKGEQDEERSAAGRQRRNGLADARTLNFREEGKGIIGILLKDHQSDTADRKLLGPDYGRSVLIEDERVKTR